MTPDEIDETYRRTTKQQTEGVLSYCAWALRNAKTYPQNFTQAAIDDLQRARDALDETLAMLTEEVV